MFKTSLRGLSLPHNTILSKIHEIVAPTEKALLVHIRFLQLFLRISPKISFFSQISENFLKNANRLIFKPVALSAGNLRYYLIRISSR